jgi:hypothetical protein
MNQANRKQWTTEGSTLLDGDGVEVTEVWSGASTIDCERDILVARFLASCVNAAESFDTVEALMKAQPPLIEEEGCGGS